MTYKRYSMLFLGISLAVIFWIFEALTHSFIFDEGSFKNQLIPQDMNELWMRSFTFLLIIVFGIYANLQIVNIEKSRKENEIIQKRLEEALTKTLSGFLPICAKCKKIRTKDLDDESRQSWEQIESYISDKTEAQFSHTICPECELKLYGHLL